MSKSDKKSLFVVVVINIIIAITALIIANIYKNDEVESEYEHLQLLSDADYFFSLESNLNKIPNYVMENDKNSLYGILSQKYISNNGISIDNVLTKFNIYSYTSFDIVDAYVISKGNLYKFFIEVNIRNNVFEENTDVIASKYIILNYSNKDIVYNIEFISGDKYKDFITGKLNVSFDNVKANEYNKFDYKDISDASLAAYYLNSFIDFIYEDSISAYNQISTTTKEKYFTTYDNFISFVDINNDMFNNIVISSYYFSGNNCYCIDNYGNEYEFIVNGISDYIVSIYFKSI